MNANLRTLASLIPAGSRVLDLGCGDGTLLSHLRDVKACKTYGVEIDDQNLIACVQKGLNVIQLNLEHGLSMFADQSFDYVLQLDTLPNVRHTEAALRETARVGKRGLISFANFAYWPLRWQVMKGRLPVTKELPYEWYNTPNVRVATYADFEALAAKCQLKVHDSFGLRDGNVIRALPNLRGSEGVFVFSS